MVRHPKYNKQENDISFLSRWSSRKEQTIKGEIKPDNEPDNTRESSDETEVDQEEVLTDTELLEKYKLTDPGKVKSEAGLTRFLDDDLPERIRQMALRRLWHLNPLFGEVCEMVEYGEDYTDAATVIEGMQTAYQVGKGYEAKVEKLEGSEVLEADVAKADVAEADVAEADVAEADVAEADVAEADVAEADVAEADVAEADVAEADAVVEGQVVTRDTRQNELAKKIIDVIEDGAVFRDNAFGVSGTDVEDYILPKNDVVLPHKEQAVIGKDSGSDSRQDLASGVPKNNNLASQNVSDGYDDVKDVRDYDQSLQTPVSRTRPARMSFTRSKNSS